MSSLLTGFRTNELTFFFFARCNICSLLQIASKEATEKKNWNEIKE